MLNLRQHAISKCHGELSASLSISTQDINYPLEYEIAS